MGKYTTNNAAGAQTIETLGGDYALKWDDETQMGVNAHAALLSQFAKAGGSLRGNVGDRGEPLERVHQARRGSGLRFWHLMKSPGCAFCTENDYMGDGIRSERHCDTSAKTEIRREQCRETQPRARLFVTRKP